MVKFESAVKNIQASPEAVYEKLSDLKNLEKLKDRLPEDKLQKLTFDSDSFSVDIDPVGKISFSVVEKEPYKMIKFGAISSPLPFSLWVQLLPVSETECKMKLTISLELNPFMKAMVQKPLQEGLEKMADMLAMINYQ
ncbi:SRPBCC family protein [Bacteroidaceae bacterium HV4-6-C5C]|jgi:Polyketide cyclase / dehydrase and lipid transport.|nr:SRPBCC family protein [Bacteroidaceae bacterium HV4-6-C5C]